LLDLLWRAHAGSCDKEHVLDEELRHDGGFLWNMDQMSRLDSIGSKAEIKGEKQR
jgi:hypothetical protein